MKKIKISKLLALNKQAVSKLNTVDQSGIVGGEKVPPTHYKICATGCVCYTSMGPSCGIVCTYDGCDVKL